MRVSRIGRWVGGVGLALGLLLAGGATANAGVTHQGPDSIKIRCYWEGGVLICDWGV